VAFGIGVCVAGGVFLVISRWVGSYDEKIKNNIHPKGALGYEAWT